MKQDELDDLLQSLPRTTASAGFTERVLRRAGEETPRRPSRLLLAFASMLLVIVTGAAGVQRHREAERLERLRAERQALARELQAIRTQSLAREPQVYLGSSGPYDFVAPLPTPNHQSRARPVSLHIADDAAF